MDRSEPSVDELADSVIHAGGEAGYRIIRDDAGRLQLTAIDDAPVTPPLTFEVTDEELHAYYMRLARHGGLASTPWKTWMLLMSTHLEEAVYKAGVLNRPCVIVISKTGFQAEPA